MKITKKQWIVGGAVALVLAGGGAGIVANNQAQAQAEKTAQEAKTAHDNLIKVATKATEKAETFKAEADVTTAQDAIKKLDEKDKTELIARVEKVRQNWDLVNTANKAVLKAEKAQTDATVKTAQTAIDKLKVDMTKSKKATLQKRLDKVKAAVKTKQAQAKAKADAAAKAKAKEQANTAQSSEATMPSNNAQDSAQVDTPTQVTPSPTDNGGASNNNTYQAVPQVPAGGGNSGNGGGTTPPPPATTYTGWVRNEAGQIVWSQGGFKTLDEAAIAAIHWLNANGPIDEVWSSGAY